MTKPTVACAMLLALFVGCRAKAPPLETWPVHGSVVDQNGERPTGGAVRLLTMNDPDLITVGPIQPDGSFTVHTQRRGFEYAGAVAGEYQIAVITSKKARDGSLAPIRFDVPQPFVVRASENQLDLRIQR